MNKILVMLSSYNGEKYIKTQITSLLAQTGVDVDILVRDDGSTDNTVDIIRSVDTDNIELKTGNNLGSCGSFLSIVKEASSDYDYYAFCDQDDFWEPDKLEIAVGYLEKFGKTRPSMYYSGQKVTDEKLNVTYFHNLDTTRSPEANYIFNQAAGCTVVFNRKLMELIKMFDPGSDFVGHEVWCHKLCTALGGNIAIESGGHILYRQHGDNCVGLSNSIGNKFKRAGKYYLDRKASIFARMITENYGEQLDDRWRAFLENIIGTSYGKPAAKVKLLFSDSIRFNSLFLRFIFVLKVLTGKI